MVKLVEASAVVVYILFVVGAGVYYSQRRSESDFWVASGDIPLSVNSFAMFSTLSSGGAFLGLIGLGYNAGSVVAWTVGLGSAVGITFGALLIARPIRGMELYTLPDVFRRLYGSDLVVGVSAVVVFTGMFLYIIGQLVAGGRVSEFLLEIDYVWAVAIIGCIFVFYVAVGGMWAVTITDFLQGAMMVCIGVLAIVVAYAKYGVAPVVETGILEPPGLSPLSIFGYFLVWVLGIPTFAHSIMRAFASRDPETAAKSYGWAAVLYGSYVLFATFLVSGAAIIVNPNLTGGEADLAFLFFIEETFPAVIAGVVTATILAATMSTTDGLLLAASAAVTNDVYKNIVNPDASERTVVRLGTLMTVVLGLLAVVISLNPPGLILEIIGHASGLLGVGLFSPLILGLWWNNVTGRGALFGMIAGPVVYGIGYLFLPPFTPVLVAFPVSLIGTVIVSLLAPFGESDSTGIERERVD